MQYSHWFAADTATAIISVSRRGTVVSYTVVHEAPAQYEMMKPYVLAIIEMEEGCRLTSQVIDVEPSKVKIGKRVESAFRKLGQDGESGIIHYGYKFRPAI